MNDWDKTERRRMNSDDHVELTWIKKILTWGIMALIAHFAAGVWWAATITANYNSIRVDIARLSLELKDSTADRYRGADAAKDFSIVNNRIERNEFRLGKIEDRVLTKQGG